MEVVKKPERLTSLRKLKKKYSLAEAKELRNNLSFQNKEKVFSPKSSVEVLLNHIKQFQFNIISNKNLTNNNKIKKAILSKFKENLSNIFEKKLKIYNLYKKENEENKEKLKKVAEESENEKYISETTQLKFLNFNIQNNIQYLDSISKAKKNIKETENNYSDDFKKSIIYCDNVKNDELKTFKIMEEEKKAVQQKLIDLAFKKEEQQLEIKAILKEISNFKNKTKDNKNVNNKSPNSYNNKSFTKKKQIRQSRNTNCGKIILNKEDYFINQNNSSSGSSNKETNFGSVKNYFANLDIKIQESNINYNYLKKKIFLDMENDKILESFHSSLDSEIY